jgi:hypothetical protein
VLQVSCDFGALIAQQPNFKYLVARPQYDQTQSSIDGETITFVTRLDNELETVENNQHWWRNRNGLIIKLKRLEKRSNTVNIDGETTTFVIRLNNELKTIGKNGRTPSN